MAQNIWDLRKLQFSLDKGKIHPIYLVFGDEPFLVDQAVKAIRSRIALNGTEDFNYDNFSASENPAARVVDAVEQIPMMTEKRLVIYRGVDALKEDSWKALLPAIENPVQSTCFVLVAEKMDKRKKYFKLIGEKGVQVELKKPYDNQVSTWIEYIAYLCEVKISREANSALQQLVGTNLSEIHNEVLKIKSYTNGRKNIELADVLDVVSKARIDNVFSLTDAIAKRDRAEALLCLANLLEHGQNEMGILALILRQLRIFSQLRDGQKQGLSSSRLSAKVGVPEFFIKKYMAQSSQWDEAKLDRAIEALYDTDRALKSSQVPSHIWLENFILRTC